MIKLNISDTIKYWLKNRLIVSNTINLTDPHNKILQTPKVKFDSTAKAISYLKNLIDTRYKYKYDWGDRIRTPNSVWNRAHDKGLRDDCDGASALAFASLKNARVQNVELITIIPVEEFWKGHTLCFFQESLTKHYHIIDYGNISPSLNSVEEALKYVINIYFKDKKSFIYSLDTFTDKWENREIKEFNV